MKLTAKVYVTEYGSLVVASTDMSTLGYKLLADHEFEFDESLIPDNNSIKRDVLLSRMEELNKSHEEKRERIIKELEDLKCQESKTLYSVI